jgi:hypothetical protein
VSSTLVFVAALAGVSLARAAARRLLSRSARARRKLARRKRVPICDASGPGLLVTGRVHRRGEPLTAPVSGRPCVAFNLLVEKHTREGWRPILEVRDARSFVVVDESGAGLVDANGPFVVALDVDDRGSTRWYNSAMGATQRQALKSLLRGDNESWSGAMTNLRYQEGVLRDGETASIGGHGVRQVSPEAPSANRRAPPEWLVLRGTAEEPLLIADSVQRASVSTSVARKKATET